MNRIVTRTAADGGVERQEAGAEREDRRHHADDVVEALRHRTGRVETRELSKAAPLLVGQLPTSDIQVDADGVAPIHCRISWKPFTIIF